MEILYPDPKIQRTIKRAAAFWTFWSLYKFDLLILKNTLIYSISLHALSFLYAYWKSNVLQQLVTMRHHFIDVNVQIKLLIEMQSLTTSEYRMHCPSTIVPWMTILSWTTFGYGSKIFACLPCPMRIMLEFSRESGDGNRNDVHALPWAVVYAIQSYLHGNFVLWFFRISHFFILLPFLIFWNCIDFEKNLIKLWNWFETP